MGNSARDLEYPLLKEEDKSQKVEVETLPLHLHHFILHPFSWKLESKNSLPTDVDAAHAQLVDPYPVYCSMNFDLTHGDVRIFTTPRRIVVSIDSLSPNQPDREDLVKGPPADKAFDKDGKPTQAALGFAKKNNLDPATLEVREIDGGKYVAAVVKQKGRPTPEVLVEALPKLVESIKFEKSMRWNDSGVAFSRPIRWYVALLGDMVIPFEYAGVVSGNISRGLRPYGSPDITIPSADKYFDVIREAGIVLDKEERKASIVEQVKQAAALIGGRSHHRRRLAQRSHQPDRNAHRSHGWLQRRIPVLAARCFDLGDEETSAIFPCSSTPHERSRSAWQRQTCSPHFIAIRNGDDIHIDTVREGNEHVLGARFADANFFVREDVKLKLEEYRPKLSALTFHTKLGSMLDKSNRMLKLGAELGAMLGFKDVMEIKYLARAVSTSPKPTSRLRW